MGLQFIDTNGTERTLTLADMATPDFQDSYSDLYKTINGFRPRGHSLETMLHFFDTYEAQFAEAEKEWELERAQRLAYLNQKFNRTFANLSEAEVHNMEQARLRYDRETQEEADRLAAAAEMTRRFSPLPVIEDWMYGSFA